MKIWSQVAVFLACLMPFAVRAEPPASSESSSGKHDSRTELARQKRLEKDFQQKLTGATLVGHYTLGGPVRNGDDSSADLKAEKYSILEVAKRDNGYWLFKSRIQYGQHDLTVPLTLKVKWAGDTPVITLDDLPVPGLGKFTVRVMIFRNRYAGTWSGQDHGGHLFGRIVKPQPDDEKQRAGGAKK